MERLQTFLTDEKAYGDTDAIRAAKTVEQTTGIRREYQLGAVGVLLVLYLILGQWAEVVCNGIGFVYPAYATTRALLWARKDTDSQWMTYWIIFALFSLTDFGSEAIMQHMPLYWLAKCACLLWLQVPGFFGARYVYDHHVKQQAIKVFGPEGKGVPVAHE